MNNADQFTSEAAGESKSAHPQPVLSAGTGAEEEVEDSKLVEQCVTGDSAAFEQLFVKYRQRVFAVAWRLLRNEDAALDVVQDAFVKAYEQLGKLRGETRFYPWIRQITVNLSIDRLRYAKRHGEVALDEHRVGEGDESREDRSAVVFSKSGSESPVRNAELSEFSTALSSALLKLSESHRTVFMLHAAEGMSYKEIADTLDCNIGTVMSRLFYARKKLQELLGAHLQDAV